MDEYRVVEHPRVFRSGDRNWRPRCPNQGCMLAANYEIKRGPRFVSRHCAPHALIECARLNTEHEIEHTVDWAGALQAVAETASAEELEAIAAMLREELDR